MLDDEFRNALRLLVDDYVETESDANAAINALHDKIESLERWKEKHQFPS